MSEIVIHIGTHKTATTTLQDLLFENRMALSSQGLVYPSIGRSSGHHTLTTHWIDLPDHYHDERSARAHWQILAETYGPSEQTVLISSEELSRGRPKHVDFSELSRFTEAFDHRRIVCVLRNQMEFVQSVYLEIAKQVVTIPFDTFFTRTIANRFSAGCHIDFTLLYEQLLRGFAPDEIVFLSYATLIRNSKGFVPSFLAALGLDQAAESLARSSPPEFRSNVSPDPLALLAATMAAQSEPPSPRLVAAAETALKEHFAGTPKEGGRTTLYTRQQVAELEALFGPLNQAFLDRIGQPELCLTFPAWDENTIYRDDLPTWFWADLAQRLREMPPDGADSPLHQ